MRTRSQPPLQPLLLALIAATAAPPLAAATKTWQCVDGVYTNTRCWTPVGLPVYPDVLQVGPVGGVDTLLRFAAGTHSVGGLVIDAPDFVPGQPGAVRFEQSGGLFQVSGRALVVADRGQASLALLPGASLSAQTLTLGQQAGASGALLMHGGSLGANGIVVGLAGVGQIDLTAGVLSTGTLQVGSRSGGSMITLSGGVLAASTAIGLGLGGSDFGQVDQSGGLLRTPVLKVGDEGAGVYVLRGNGQVVAAQQRVGLGGQGVMQQQDAGSRNTATELLLGVSHSARYELLGGELVSASTRVGQGASAYFAHTGGSHRVGDLQIGSDRRAGGGYQLSGGLLAAVSVRVGAIDAVGSFVQNGGSHQVDDALEISAGSSYTLRGQGVLALAGNGVALNQGLFEHQNGARFVGALDNAGSFVFGSTYDAGLPVFDGRLINRGTVTLRVNGSFADGLRNEGVFSSLVAGRSLALDGAGLDNAGTLLLRGGVLQGNGALRNHALFSGFGRIGGSAGFFNDGLVQQDGGALVLAGGQTAYNRGRWVGQARQALLLDGAAVSFNNLGQLVLADGLINGSGVLVNDAAGTVTGSGTISTRFINAGSLVLGAADRQRVNGPFINTGLIDMGAASALLSGSVLSNSGLVAGRGRIANAVSNLAGGRIQADGGVLALAGAVGNQGLLVAGPGGTLLLQGGMTQPGRLQLEGGTLDLAGNDLVNEGVIGGFGTLRGAELVNRGQMLFSGGDSQVHANLDQPTGARLVVSGGSVATFHGTLRARAGSELRVSERSGAVFFGPVSQESGAAFTGAGTSWFEGGLSVGNSPGEGGVAGTAVLGEHNLYRAEIGGLLPGIGHDRFSASGHLQLGGALQLSWWGGFTPQAGQRFDLFDWGSSSGRFSLIDLAAAPLPDGLHWDASRLYVDGSMAVAAVPEPAAWLMLAGGLAGLICRRRLMRFQAGRTDQSATYFTGSPS